MTTNQAAEPVLAGQREQIATVIYNKGAYCGNCDYDGWDSCVDCRSCCLVYADAALAELRDWLTGQATVDVVARQIQHEQDRASRQIDETLERPTRKEVGWDDLTELQKDSFRAPARRYLTAALAANLDGARP